MSKPKVGRILDPDSKPTRDAIHIPIIPVYAGRDGLKPGDKVHIAKGCFEHEGKLFAHEDYGSGDCPKWIGVIDPNIEDTIKMDDLVYVWLKPESVRKLWHEWTHDKIDKL